ncbi:hypothetical protein M3Y98_00072700 [Aphelenchoides besseyi]|nr:hypothetical protein M3Y98_00072700 [Aphelenchoides besseyi]KAI6198738.1 hypothetical protein M3Y96_00551300 [Aphelenchoides besseyi]
MCYYSVERLLNESTNTSALSSQYAWLYAAVDWIEVILSLFSALFVGIGLYIFYYCPIFNRNLISIGYTLGLNFYGILLSRLAVIFLLMSKKRSAYKIRLEHVISCTAVLSYIIFVAVFVVVFSKDILVRQVGIMIFNFAIIFYAISIIGVILLRVAAYKKKLIQYVH